MLSLTVSLDEGKKSLSDQKGVLQDIVSGTSQPHFLLFLLLFLLLLLLSLLSLLLLILLLSLLSLLFLLLLPLLLFLFLLLLLLVLQLLHLLLSTPLARPTWTCPLSDLCAYCLPATPQSETLCT